MERLVHQYLAWRVGPLHDCLFIYVLHTRAAVTPRFLGRLGEDEILRYSSLDLAKAFEIAIPRSSLVLWLRFLLIGRSGRVKFQGHVSSAHSHDKGTFREAF